jgi:hypothetical protein
MVTITLTSSTATFEVEGLDKLWTLRSRLEIPLEHIAGVHADTTIAKGWWHGFRLGGTNIPGILSAGTFYQDGGFMFWDVHDPEKTIVVELTHEHYKALVIEVADPAGAVSQLQARLAKPGR